MPPLPRATAESQGINSDALLHLLDGFEERELDIHSLMILRRGKVLAEGWWAPYSADRKHQLFSLSKSFTSIAAGFAARAGLISLDDPVIKFFPDKLPDVVSDNLAAMRIRHLLMMGTGHGTEPTVYTETDWAKAFLAVPPERTPGTHFMYNTAATYMVSAILHQVTGEDLVDFLHPRLFLPLDIDGSTWERCPLGVRTGGFGLSLRTEDIAKFGVMLQQEGVFGGIPVMSPLYIDQATSKQIDCSQDRTGDWAQGYGFQFWMCQNGAYRGDGAFGQFCVVHPELHLVVAITSGVTDLQGVLDVLWERLLPQVHGKPKPVNPETSEKLRSRLANLRLRRPFDRASHQEVNGSFWFEGENDLDLGGFSVQADGESVVLTLFQGDQEHRIRAYFDRWEIAGECAFMSSVPTRYGVKQATPYAARAGWNAPDEMNIRLAYVDTPFTPWFRLKFEEGACRLLFVGAVSLFDPGDRQEMVGIRK